MIDQFAACTGDRQWIHVDADRACNQSAVGGTIAHGFLSLSLIAPLGTDLGLAPVNAFAVLNYGLDKVRFLKPVKSGNRVRLAVHDRRRTEGRRAFADQGQRVPEIENSETPALVAETLTLVIP